VNYDTDLKLYIPEEFLAPRGRVINPDCIELGTDLISGVVQLKFQDARRIYMVVNVLRHLDDLVTFDVGLVEHDRELPRSLNTLDSLVMVKELCFGTWKYKISQDQGTSTGTTSGFVLAEEHTS
jgi:hypothetical protein